MIHPNKSRLKFWRKKSVGVSKNCPNFLGVPILSQERVKLRNTKFGGTFIGSIGKSPLKISRKTAVGVVRDCRLPKIARAPIYSAHRAFIFAITHLSCFICRINKTQSAVIALNIFEIVHMRRTWVTFVRPKPVNLYMRTYIRCS